MPPCYLPTLEYAAFNIRTLHELLRIRDLRRQVRATRHRPQCRPLPVLPAHPAPRRIPPGAL